MSGNVMAPEPPICLNCRHVVGIMSGPIKCARPVSIPFDPVTGATRKRLMIAAHSERGLRLTGVRTRCGPRGRFFEAKAGA